MDLQLLHYDSLESTNSEAAKLAREGASDGVCVVVDEQTAGRGRQGREWISTKGSGVYMSLILRPRVDPRGLTLIPLIAAIAVHQVLLYVLTIEADIKWPNDILVNEKKICGILCEAVDTPSGMAVVVGIGINMSAASVDNATSIQEESQTPTNRDYLVRTIFTQIDRRLGLLNGETAQIIDDWSRRSSYAFDKEVSVDLGNEVFAGTTCGLDENG
ncbi:MAG TPA: biotin--[acetyl-CoA-carboxylase] ligase, partial [Pyrinomonadaceae bacterium]